MYIMTKSEKTHPLIKYIQHLRGFNAISRKMVTYFLLKVTLAVISIGVALVYFAE